MGLSQKMTQFHKKYEGNLTLTSTMENWKNTTWRIGKRKAIFNISTTNFQKSGLSVYILNLGLFSIFITHCIWSKYINNYGFFVLWEQHHQKVSVTLNEFVQWLIHFLEEKNNFKSANCSYNHIDMIDLCMLKKNAIAIC